MSNELAKPAAGPIATLQSFFEARKASLAQVLPKHMTADRVIKIVLAAASRTPRILECTPESVYLACHSASQLGLEPCGPLGHAYLVPYRNGKTGRMECQYQPGYRGLVELARRSGTITSIAARLVHEEDRLEYYEDEKGLHFNFKPATGERGKIIAAFAYAIFKDGGCQFEHMTVEELDAIRARSKSKDEGPWVSDTGEMYRKTVLKRLCKLLPANVELAEAVEQDDLAVGAPTITLPATVVQPKTRTEQLKEKLALAEPPPANDVPAAADAEQEKFEREMEQTVAERAKAIEARVQEPPKEQPKEQPKPAATAKKSAARDLEG